MAVSQVLLPQEPQLKDLLDLFRKDILLNLNCHAIAEIETFNPVNQTAIASVNYKKTYFLPNAITGTYEPELVDYPFLVDMPVVVLGGGSTALTFPITKGDDGIVLFNDRDIDNWFKGSSESAVNTPRLHSFSDGVIIVGLRSLQHVLAAYDPSRVVLRKGLLSRLAVDTSEVAMEFDTTGTKVKAGALIDIENTAGGTLGTSLQNLITELKTLVLTIQAITVASVPIDNSAAFVPITTQLTVIATKLGLLLS